LKAIALSVSPTILTLFAWCDVPREFTFERMTKSVQQSTNGITGCKKLFLLDGR
jgi:hypothetical protein